MKHLIAWLQCQKGVTSVEYGLIGGGIGLTLVIGMTFFGDSFNTVMTTFSDYLGSVDS